MECGSRAAAALSDSSNWWTRPVVTQGNRTLVLRPPNDEEKSRKEEDSEKRKKKETMASVMLRGSQDESGNLRSVSLLKSSPLADDVAARPCGKSNQEPRQSYWTEFSEFIPTNNGNEILVWHNNNSSKEGNGSISSQISFVRNRGDSIKR